MGPLTGLLFQGPAAAAFPAGRRPAAAAEAASGGAALLYESGRQDLKQSKPRTKAHLLLRRHEAAAWLGAMFSGVNEAHRSALSATNGARSGVNAQQSSSSADFLELVAALTLQETARMPFRPHTTTCTSVLLENSFQAHPVIRSMRFQCRSSCRVLIATNSTVWSNNVQHNKQTVSVGDCLGQIALRPLLQAVEVCDDCGRGGSGATARSQCCRHHGTFAAHCEQALPWSNLCFRIACQRWRLVKPFGLQQRSVNEANDPSTSVKPCSRFTWRNPSAKAASSLLTRAACRALSTKQRGLAAASLLALTLFIFSRWDSDGPEYYGPAVGLEGFEDDDGGYSYGALQLGATSRQPLQPNEMCSWDTAQEVRAMGSAAPLLLVLLCLAHAVITHPSFRQSRLTRQLRKTVGPQSMST
jgi:hypothetical protein